MYFAGIHPDTFPYAPGQTDAAIHDVNVGKAMPIKQHAYRVNPIRRMFTKELNTCCRMEQYNLAKASGVCHASLCQNMIVVSGSAWVSKR